MFFNPATRIRTVGPVPAQTVIISIEGFDHCGVPSQFGVPRWTKLRTSLSRPPWPLRTQTQSKRPGHHWCRRWDVKEHPVDRCATHLHIHQ